MYFQNTKKKIVATLLAFVLLGSFTPISHTNDAHAQSVTVVGGVGTVQETISAAANVVMEAVNRSLEIKEFTLDNIAYGIARQALKSMTGSIVEWINSGFQGNPAFVQDLEAHLTDLGDKAAGELIYGSELSFLCSPIEINIRAALAVQQFSEFEEQVQCTLTDVVDNIDSFYSGNFAAGGWPGWFELVTKPQNNPYGALALASAELNARVTTAQDLGETELAFGSGFLSFKECTPVDGKKRANGEPYEQCLTVTPGQVIVGQLEEGLSYGGRSLIEADEINEIIGALFSQIGQQALTAAGGLSGLSRGNSSTGESSYLDRLEQEQRPQDVTFEEETNFLRRALDAENDMADLELDVVLAVNDLESFIESASNTSCAGVPDELPSRFVNDREASADALADADATIADLEDILTRYNAATTDRQRFDIFREFSALEAAGLTHSNVDVVKRGFEIDSILSRVSQQRASIQQALDFCNGGGP